MSDVQPEPEGDNPEGEEVTGSEDDGEDLGD